jgi:PAS domain S-box-containing protein
MLYYFRCDFVLFARIVSINRLCFAHGHRYKPFMGGSFVTRAQARFFFAILAAIALLGFGWWCVSLVLSVGEQREAVEKRASLLFAMQQIQTSLYNSESPLSTQQNINAEMAKTLPTALAQEFTLQLALFQQAKEAGPPSEEAIKRFGGTLSQVILELRRQTGALSSLLGSNWDSLNYLVLMALLLTASNFLFFFRAQQKNQKLQQLAQGLEQELATRLQTEALLRSSQLRNQLIIDGSNDGIWDWDLLQEQISYSPRWLSMLGILAPLQGTIEEWLTRVHPEDEQRVRRELQAHIAGKTPLFESEHRIRHEGGAYLWVLTRGMTLYDQEKKPQRVAGSQTDITKRRTLALIEENTALLEYATSFLGVGVVMLRNAEVSYLGASLQEMSNPWGDFSTFWAHLQRENTFPGKTECPHCHTSVRQGRLEARLQTPSGEPLVFSVVFTGHGHPLGRDQEEVLLVQNVTGLNQLQTQLQQTERLASLGLMAAGLAHELNNPLTYTLLSLDALAAQLPDLLRDPDSTESQATARTLLEVGEGVKRIQRIAREVRLFSHPTNEAPKPTQVHAVLDAAISAASLDINTQITIVNHASTEASYVLANEELLCQVFVNLLLNAAQSIPEAAHRQRIVIEASREGASVVIQITDTGVGIAASHIEKIFEPFFTTKSLIAGTGLGLAISHRLISLMGGEITVKSNIGVGSTFMVTLPICEAPVEAIKEVLTPSRLRVLVVDDEVFILYFLQKILAEHEVSIAKSVDEAMEKIIHESTFDVVLSDLNMPNKSGEDLFDLLQKHPRFTGSLLFMSGGGYVSKKESFTQYLKLHCLEKPFDLDRLKASLTTTSHQSHAMPRHQS